MCKTHSKIVSISGKDELANTEWFTTLRGGYFITSNRGISYTPKCWSKMSFLFLLNTDETVAGKDHVVRSCCGYRMIRVVLCHVTG